MTNDIKILKIAIENISYITNMNPDDLALILYQENILSEELFEDLYKEDE